jgi:transcriptional accessory protein Tex/SPT6
MTDQDTATVEEATVSDKENLETPTPESSTEATEPEVAESPQNDPAASKEAKAEEVPASSEAEVEDPDSIHGLKAGQHLVGTVKNITNFGAFVDIGLPQDGLVHISELSRRKVDKVTDVVSVGQEIEVWVKKVDKKRGRISLTMVKPITRRLRDIKEGDEFEGVVTRLESYGAFVDIESDREGLVHISQITHDYINHPQEALSVGDKVNVKVLKVNRKKRQVDLSMKALLPPPAPTAPELSKEPVVAQAAPEQTDEEGTAPTAMALAYAAFQDEQETEEEEQQEEAQGKAKQKEEMDSIIARTLASRD